MFDLLRLEFISEIRYMSNSKKIRRQFIDFFVERDHTVVPSAPVAPADDPTLLFTNAGMNQFKDVFLEQGSRPYSRAVDSQKIIRVSGKHNDLEEVGDSPIHHTFFEMLGNWSFGDYYKPEAIRWAWELLTKVWNMDAERIYATVFEGTDEAPYDKEAFDGWLAESGIDKERVSLHGAKDNFWEMGEVGPCGPCSELHYDLGEEFCAKKDVPDHKCKVNGDCGRFIELWNLVFIQYRRDREGKLHPLPRKHVDTGAGFERIVRVLEGAKSNYETSIFQPLIDKLANLSGVKYHPGKEGKPHRVAVDHVRSISFSLADGVLPSNEGRGYVIRRILRRAARYGREIGLESPFIFKLVDPLVENLGDAYPEIKERYKHITGVIKAEEESFARTLGRGLELFGNIIERVEQEKSNAISGSDAFKLYDTYGFPLDLTELMARERNLTVDKDEFDALMAEQRRRARGGDRFKAGGELGEGMKSEFAGYDLTETWATILAAAQDKKQTEIVLDKTPFYAEAGGQVADWGIIETGGGKLFVKEVAKVGDAIVHRGKWKGGSLPDRGEAATARIDLNRRRPIQYNHTATHLVHAALRKHLGPHATQAGSLVAPDRLRFDFTHFERLTPEQIEEIEKTVNEAIRADYPVCWYEKPFQEAVDAGVTALFGEKYGDTVRIIHIGDLDAPYSRELCGGTHVDRTGSLGLFRIVYEGAVSAGVRRIEAVTGEAALEMMHSDRNELDAIKDLLSSHGSSPSEKLAKTLEEKKALEKELQAMHEDWAQRTAREMIERGEEVNGVSVLTGQFENLSIDWLKMVGDAIRSGKGAYAALMTTSLGKSGQLCCVVSDEAMEKHKLKAGDLVGKAAKLAGGGGGGRPHMATAGTRQPELLGKAAEAFGEIVKGG